MTQVRDFDIEEWIIELTYLAIKEYGKTPAAHWALKQVAHSRRCLGKEHVNYLLQRFEQELTGAPQ